MASIPLKTIKERVRERADMENSGFIKEPELDAYINNSYKELYDILTLRFEDYHSAEFITSIGQNESIPLPADLYKVRGVDSQSSVAGGDNWLTVRKFNFQERNKTSRVANRRFMGGYNVQYRVMGNQMMFTPPDQSAGTYRIWYIPLCKDLAEGKAASLNNQGVKYESVDLYEDGNKYQVQIIGGGTAGSEVVDVTGNILTVQVELGVSTNEDVVLAVNSANLNIKADTLTSATVVIANPLPPTNLKGGVVQVDADDYNGWIEYVIVDAAIKCLQKEESDTTALERAKSFQLQRIENAAQNRDVGEPERISDTSRNGGWLGWDGSGDVY